MAGRPEIINKSKASSHPLKHGRFYTGSVTAVLSNGKINVKIPELGTQYGPLMPLNTTPTSRYIVGDSVKCAFADEFFNEIIVFGSTRVREDVFAVSDRGVDRFASQSARDAAIPSPEEGRIIYVLDTDELQVYNGTEWITVIDTGNSENITAASLVATSASIGTLTVTGASTLNVLGATNLTASTSIGNVNSTEIGYLDGVTSAIQTQINLKSPTSNPTFTGTVIIPTLSVTGNESISGSLSITGNESISGSLSVTGNAVIGGNLTVNGTTSTINSTVTTLDDPIITLGGDTAPTSDDNKDRGIEFRYHSGTAASLGFMGYDDSTGRFTFLTGATNSSEVFSGTLGTIDISSVVATGGTITVRTSSAQDGIILQGRSGGTGTYAITMTPGTLTASRTLTLPDTAGTVITTGDSQTITSTMIANDTIVNADINSAAAIADTKLATISTAGKVANSATTATSSNTANAIVTRDASGNFSAGTVTAALSGTVSSSGEIATSGHIRSGATGLTDAGSVSATNWFRSTGGSGWYNATYTGGIWMSDSTWVRVYGSKNFYCDSELRANRYSGDGTARYGSYGSISITGSKNGWAGIDNDTTSSAFMWTNNLCGHYYDNNSWNWYFDRGTLRLLGDSNYMLSYVDQNGALPWCKGPYLQGSNGWAFFNVSTGAWEMGQRYAPGGQNYAWVRGGLIIGTTPDDAFANTATLAVRGSGSFTVLPNSTDLDGTYQNVGGGNWKLAYNPWSTRKVKREIGPVGEELDPIKLLNLEVIQFKYKEDHLSETDSIYDKFICGLIAEDVADIYPIIVRKDKETGEPQSINYNLLIPPLLALVQKMSLRIDTLEQRISTLENV